MSTVAQAAAALKSVLDTIDGVRAYADLGARVDPPGVLIGPPTLGWRAFCGPRPTSARFPLWVVAAADERGMSVLWDLVPAVAKAVEQGMPSAAVQDGPSAASPTVYPSAGIELPAYQLLIEVDL